METSHLDHLVLTVKSIDATVDFYSRVMGMTSETFGEGRTALTYGSQKLTCTNSAKNSNRRR